MEGELRRRVRSSLRRTAEIVSFSQSQIWTSLTTNLLPAANHHHTHHQHHRVGLPYIVKIYPLLLDILYRQRSSSSSQLLQPKRQMSAQRPTSKTASPHSRRNSYSSSSRGVAVTQYSPSSPVPRKTRLLSSTYNPKHSLLTRGGSATELGRTAVGTGKQIMQQEGRGASNTPPHSNRKPQSNDMSDLVVTSARIVSKLKKQTI